MGTKSQRGKVQAVEEIGPRFIKNYIFLVIVLPFISIAGSTTTFLLLTVST